MDTAMLRERGRLRRWELALLLGVAVLVLLVALISRALRESGHRQGHPYRDNARDEDFISFYDKDAVK